MDGPTGTCAGWERLLGTSPRGGVGILPVLLVVDGGDGLAFVRGGHEDVDDALLGLGIDFFAFEKVVNLVVA